MKKDYTSKNRLMWFSIMNSGSFLGGLLDALTWIPYAQKGGLGGFPIYSLFGIYIGCMLGLIYSIINIKNIKLLREDKIKQITISVMSLIFPVVTFLGLIMGGMVGWAICRLMVFL